MGKGVAYAVALVAGVVVVGWVAVNVLQVLAGVFAYLIIGALAAAGALWVYGRVRRELSPGTRTQRRIEAAARTYRMRNR